jgi:hypothetical protein
LTEQGLDERIILKLISEIGIGMCIGLICLRRGTSECDNEPSVSIKFLD